MSVTSLCRDDIWRGGFRQERFHHRSFPARRTDDLRLFQRMWSIQPQDARAQIVHAHGAEFRQRDCHGEA